MDKSNLCVLYDNSVQYRQERLHFSCHVIITLFSKTYTDLFSHMIPVYVIKQSCLNDVKFKV